MTDDISSLTVDELEDAAKAIAERQTINNPIIQWLQENITSISMQVPGSFSEKLQFRSKIRGLNV